VELIGPPRPARFGRVKHSHWTRKKKNRGVAFSHHRGYPIKPLAIATVESLRDERGSGSAKHPPGMIPAHA